MNSHVDVDAEDPVFACLWFGIMMQKMDVKVLWNCPHWLSQNKW